MWDKFVKTVFSQNAGRFFLNFMLFGLIFLTNYASFNLFQGYIKIYTLVLGLTIFIIVWNSHKIIDNDFLTFVGIGLFFSSILDLTQVFAFVELGLFLDYDANLTIQLWIAARFMMAFTFIFAPIFSKFKQHLSISFIVYIIVSAVLLMMIFVWRNFPLCYIEGQGLTSYKIYSEYIIMLMLFLSMMHLAFNQKKMNRTIFYLIEFSLLIQILAEFALVRYDSSYSLNSLIGLGLRLIGIYLMYWAIVVIGLSNPLSVLVKNLKDNQERYNAIIMEMNKAIVSYLPVDKGRDFIIQEFNQAAEKIEKIKKKEVIGKRVTKVFPGIKAMGLLEVLQRVNQTGMSEHFPATIYQDTRLTGWRDNYIYKLSSGEIIASYSDITKEKQAEQILKERSMEADELGGIKYGQANKIMELSKEIEALKQKLATKKKV